MPQSLIGFFTSKMLLKFLLVVVAIFVFVNDTFGQRMGACKYTHLLYFIYYSLSWSKHFLITRVFRSQKLNWCLNRKIITRQVIGRNVFYFFNWVHVIVYVYVMVGWVPILRMFQNVPRRLSPLMSWLRDRQDSWPHIDRLWALGNAQWAEPSPLFAHRARPTLFNVKTRIWCLH